MAKLDNVLVPFVRNVNKVKFFFYYLYYIFHYSISIYL